MQLTKSKWRNDPLKFFLFPLPGCPSSEFTKVPGSISPVRGKIRLRGNNSTHQIEKFRNKKGSFLDQYVRDSSENLREMFEEHL